MDTAPVPGHDDLPKRRAGERRGNAPDLSSSWWTSLAGEERLAGRLSKVLAAAEAGVAATVEAPVGATVETGAESGVETAAAGERGDGPGADDASPVPVPPGPGRTPDASFFRAPASFEG